MRELMIYPLGERLPPIGQTSKALGPRAKDQGPRTKDQVPRTKGQVFVSYPAVHCVHSTQCHVHSIQEETLCPLYESS